MAAVDVTVVVPFTGEPWATWARKRAMPSARDQALVVAGEGETVAQARNNGLDQVQTEWVVFLDADDELSPDYIERMKAGSADVRAPLTRWVTHPGYSRADRQTGRPMRVWGHAHDCVGDCLAYGNWIVIGAMMRTDIARRCRWEEWPIWEDWDWWVQAWQAGATFEQSSAVYIAHSARGGRNSSLPRADADQVHRDIARRRGLPVPA